MFIIDLQVADCVCLMSLDKAEAVPIDTHVRQIAVRDYNYHLKSKSLTRHAYQELGRKAILRLRNFYHVIYLLLLA